MKAICTGSVIAAPGWAFFKNGGRQFGVGLFLIVCVVVLLCPCAYANIVPIRDCDKPACPVCQSDYFRLEDRALRAQFTIIMEEAGFASTNRFGIFDLDIPTQRLEIFRGLDERGDRATVKFDLHRGLAWINSMRKIHIGPVFGFYLDSIAHREGGIFYSDSLLNTGGDFEVSHMRRLEFCGGKTVLAFEDLRADVPGCDWDFDDMVISVTNIRPYRCVIPEPGTATLLSLCYVIWIAGEKRTR
ncbi:MAG: DUF4114 domain-containing protein [Sedimentisphaerales bacterium]|nr:DUF4114 domain-containing protein [Sedimentisphaerales bacterium]